MGIYWNMQTEVRDADGKWRVTPHVLWDGHGQCYLRKVFWHGWDDYPEYPNSMDMQPGVPGDSPLLVRAPGDWDDPEYPWASWVGLRTFIAYPWDECSRIEREQHHKNGEEVRAKHGPPNWKPFGDNHDFETWFLTAGWGPVKETVAETIKRTMIDPLVAIVGDKLDDARVIIWQS